MIRFMNPANAITLLGLLSALAGALLAVNGHLAHGVIGLVVAGVCDLLDGLVARRLKRTEEEARFGKHLDSAVDAGSFGIAPTLLLEAAGLRSAPELALLGFYACCAVWRLAYFDTIGLSTEKDVRYYTGLPTTFSALILPLAFLAGFQDASSLRIAGDVAAAALALLMVSPLKIPKPGGIWYGILVLIALGLIGVYAGFAARFTV